jgi:hypothetical protein
MGWGKAFQHAGDGLVVCCPEKPTGKGQCGHLDLLENKCSIALDKITFFLYRLDI